MKQSNQQRPAISVVIPSYNGASLLKKHLDSVLKILQAGDELIVVDDASPDHQQTLKYLKERFDLKLNKKLKSRAKTYQANWSKLNIILALNKENLRFGGAVNLGFKLASQQLVFLINNDVEPSLDVLDFLIPHFADQRTFAVTCLEQTGQDPSALAGKNKLWFKQGIFQHSKADNLSFGPTAWAGGGSSLIDRDKFLKLGGFDARYKPAYWEDVDLSFQAKKHGWQVLFEPQAKVTHYHETTNQTVFGQKQIDKMSWLNAKKFTKKNANFWQKIAYYLWRPYWLIKEIKLFSTREDLLHKLALVLILILAAGLRLYKLGQVPHGMAWDEAAIGYNGFAIWQTFRDEWLTRLPISFRSFGDYKAPLAIYLNGLSTSLLGLNLAAVRLPFVLSGVFAVLGIYLLGKELLINKKDGQHWSLFLAFILAISPWHLHYSRLAFESGLALTILIWAVYHFYRYLNIQANLDLIKSSLLAVLSLYAYHSSKVTVPLLFIYLLISNRHRLNFKWSKLLLPVVLVIVTLTPLIYDTIYGSGLTRINSSVLLGSGNIGQKLSMVLTNFLSYFSLDFLIRGANAGQLRHGDGLFGVLSYSSLALIIYALITLWKNRQNVNYSQRLIIELGLAWIVLGILPAAIGDGMYHSNRALLALPGFLILATVGAEQLVLDTWSSWQNLRYVILVTYIFFLALYQQHYYTVYAQQSTAAFADGYLEAAQLVKSLDNPQVEKIIFTDDYQQAYLYVLIANVYNPYQYHTGILEKYEFTKKTDVGDFFRKNAIIVASAEDEMGNKQPNYQIYAADGSLRFRVYLTGD